MKIRTALRVASRIGVVLAVCGIAALAGVDYARIIGRNVALARQLDAVQRDVVVLDARRTEQEREIRRLSDPQGAIPEIHDRLHLVGDHEAIIYIKKRADGT